VHLGLYRFVQLGAGVSACPADPTTSPGAAVLGYAAVRPDRVRTEYAATGQILSMTDATGVELRYVYTNEAAAGQPRGALRYVYEPRSCSYTRASATDPGPMPASCRSFTLTTDPGGSTNFVTDPAGRGTYYSHDSGALVGVDNPDYSSLSYEYDGQVLDDHGERSYISCGGAAGQLCTVWDGRYGQTRFTYEAAPTGPPRVKTVTDRRGLVSTFDYGQSTTTVTAGQHRQVFTGIDAAGRVARLVATDTAGTLYRDTRTTWDTPAAPCNQPDARLDNNQCRVQAVQTSTQPGAAPGQDTQTTFSEQGLPLAVRRANGTGGYDTTTAGYRTQHVGPTGTTVYTDSIIGGGQVSSSTAQAGPRSGGGGTLYTVTDRVATLTARGNAAPAPGAGTPANPDWTAYQTRFTVDATETVTPGTADPTGVCRGAQTNTGLVCAVDAPAYDSTGRPSTTRYTYDPAGQRTTMTTPKAVAETPAGQTPPAYRYTYYPDGATDLSGLGNAGGWLRGVTDPAGKFVAYGYDRAGNVVRTWDRNATAGRALSDFPGTLATPTTGRYTETLYRSVGSSRDPSQPAMQDAVSRPWRFVRSSRDALGNRTSTDVDANGNPTRVTPPRGTQAAPAGGTAPPTYDVTAGYDAGDLQVRSLTPAEAQANGSPTDKPTTSRYDIYGHPYARTDPRGVVTAYDYDNADRPVATTWSRGPAGPDAPRACRTSGPADSDRYGPNVTLCTAATRYDGLDQATASSDGNAQVSTYSYDAQGRRTDQYTPRDTYTTLHTAVLYNPDGNPTTVCRPRQFTDGYSVYDPASGDFEPPVCNATSQYANQIGYDVAGRRASSRTYRDADTPLTATWTYDADGNPVAATDPNAHTTSTGTDLLDRPLTVTRPRDAATTYTVSYRYDPVGNRTSVTTPVDATTSRTDAYAYDALNRTTDRVQGADNPDALLAGAASGDGGANIRTRTLYDADGRPVAAYGPRAFTASTTSPDPRFLTRTDIDADGRPTASYTPRYDTADTGRTDDPTGTGGTQAADCPTGANPAAVAVPASMPAVPDYPVTVGVCVTRTGYDPAGLAVTTTLATAGGAAPGATARQTSTAYTDDRLPTAVTTPSPTGTGTATTRTRYDAVGQPLSVTDPLGAMTTTSYTSDNLVAGTTAQNYARSDGTPVTHSTTYSYDADGERTAVTDALGQTAPTYYTTDGLVSYAGSTGGGYTRYSYDKVGNPTSVWSPSGYSGDETNPARIPTVNTFTADDLPATTLQPPSTDGLRRRTTWTYDTGGRKIRQQHDSVDPASGALTPGGAQTFAYYPDSRLAASPGRGDGPTSPEVIRTAYDPAGAATSVTDTTGGGSTVTSSYYLDGQPRTVANGTETTASAYDGAGQPARRQQVPTAGPPATSTYAYTDAGTPSTSTSSTVAASATTPWTWAFDAAGRKTREDTPEGQSTTSRYNPDNTLTEQTTRRGSTPTTALVSQWRYTYDNLTRQLTADNTAMMPGDPGTAPRSQRHTFGYDTTGRLTALTDDRGPHTISYDRDGNRLSYSTTAAPGLPAVTQRSHYNPDDSVKDATDGTPANTPSTSSYRAAGVLNDDGCYTYSFDGFDRMSQARPKTGSACANAPSSSTTAYSYDGLDRQRATDVTTKTTTQHRQPGRHPVHQHRPGPHRHRDELRRAQQQRRQRDRHHHPHRAQAADALRPGPHRCQQEPHLAAAGERRQHHPGHPVPHRRRFRHRHHRHRCHERDQRRDRNRLRRLRHPLRPLGTAPHRQHPRDQQRHPHARCRQGQHRPRRKPVPHQHQQQHPHHAQRHLLPQPAPRHRHRHLPARQPHLRPQQSRIP